MTDTRQLIYKDDAIRAVLKANPSIAYCINNIRPVDAVEVIHARWEIECRNRKRCSNCSLRINTDTQIEGNFCPICGAMMDGGNEDV